MLKISIQVYWFWILKAKNEVFFFYFVTELLKKKSQTLFYLMTEKPNLSLCIQFWCRAGRSEAILSLIQRHRLWRCTGHFFNLASTEVPRLQPPLSLSVASFSLLKCEIVLEILVYFYLLGILEPKGCEKTISHSHPILASWSDTPDSL